MERNLVIKKLKIYFHHQDEVLFAYLFGSYAKLNYRNDSDIDIGIYIKDSFKDSIIEYKIAKIGRLQEISGRPIDLIIINDAPPLLKHEIFRDGILLKNLERSFLIDYKVKSFYEYLDQQYIINRFFAKNKVRIQAGIGDGH